MIKWRVDRLSEHAEDRGGVPEWLKGADCKSVGVAYAGSNPASPTSTTQQMAKVECTLTSPRIQNYVKSFEPT